MTYDEWVEKYKPIANLLNQDARFDGTMYETYGDEYAIVSNTGQVLPERIWTLIEGEDGNEWIVCGHHIVNRIGYFICAESFDRKSFIEISTD